MAKHKAATEVTIAPTEEKSTFALTVEKLWMPAAAVAVLATAAILFLQYQNQTAMSSQAESWARLLEVVDDEGSAFLKGDPDEIGQIAEELKGQVAAPWAFYVQATSAIEERDFQTARTALDSLRSQYPQHQLCTDTYEFEGRDLPSTLPDHLNEIIVEMEAWSREQPHLFENPDLPEGSPRVRLNTPDGPITVGLYQELAPKHVANFLKLAEEGFYSNTRFHRVQRNFMIQGGDPNSKNVDEPETWGQGGPGYNVEKEENDLVHFPGYFAAAKKSGDTESSGSQFYITTAASHHLDGQHVVYGKVIEGMDLAHEIERGAIAEGASDRPESPVIITSVEVL